MGITFTPDQQKVITTRNQNILVSAAAGSGKTAVLVERIVQMVSDPEHPIDIDRLLIVTFTSAAASEMRERISNALMKRIDEHPENEHLQKQMTLIHNAQITTIDSFCLFIIRNNFNDIGLDPGFRVADEGELQLLQKDVLAEVLEQRFQEREENFYHCVECYSTNGKEKVLEDHILQLYKFAMSYPFPEKWLTRCKEDYEITSVEELQQAAWVQDMMHRITQMVMDCVEQLNGAVRLCEQSDGPYMYAELLEAEQQMLAKITECADYSSYYEAFQTLAFGRLSSKKDDTVSKEKREMVKLIRNGVKDSVQKIRSQYFWISPEQSLQDIRSSAPAIHMLIDLTLQFMEVLAAQKREKNIVDFTDMEHFALRILLQEENGEIIPSRTAVTYQAYFEEILIDEYQDSNLVQEYLLKSVSKEGLGEYNRFMVGDVKQSIYKFRLARPEIFMEKYYSYQPDGSNMTRIDLKQNFRSREEVIESVNYLFYQIMIESLGGVQYDKDSALYPGAVYPSVLPEGTQENEPQQSNQTEILLIEKEEEAENARETEALVIAQRIQELAGTFLVTDKETGQLRPAMYRDIVILLRSNSGWDETFRKTLMEEGIPAHITSKTGYFSSIEIQTALNFLKVLDNPLQDVPLCATLTSMVFGFTDEELAKIRIVCRKGLFYEALLYYAENGEDIALQHKITAFIELIDTHREKISYTPIHELLHMYMEETGFYYYMSALPGGEQRKANMDKLLEKAIDFEKTSYHGLFRFIRYIEQMQKYDVDLGEANIQDENANVVRIMSIHKSKGLEFPICFVSGMAKKFNMQDARKVLVVDMDIGLGTDYINAKERYKTTTLRKNVIVMKMQQENLGEELRILYVAMTRAKEKLIVTGVVDNVEKKITRVLQITQNQETALPYTMLAGMNSFLDYILAALVRHRCMSELLQKYGMTDNPKNQLYDKGPEMQVKVCNAVHLIEDKVRETIQKESIKRQLHKGQLQKLTDRNRIASITEKFSYQYPHTILSRLYTKTTVSELKKMGQTEVGELGKILYEEPEIVPYIPRFMQKQEVISGTARGSAYHRVLELLDLESVTDASDIKEQMCAFVREGRLSEAYMQAVRIDKIIQFLQTGLAARMRNANKKKCLYREQPFVIGVPANLLEKDFPEEESILVQGIIDVYFEEADGLVIADYKTDKVDSGDELWKRYQKQLDYYAEALEQLLELPVKEKIIYSFALGQEFSST